MSALFTVPVSITAKSRDELTVKMVANNIKSNITYKYFDLQQNGKVHVAWYLADATKRVKMRFEKELAREIANGAT